MNRREGGKESGEGGGGEKKMINVWRKEQGTFNEGREDDDDDAREESKGVGVREKREERGGKGRKQGNQQDRVGQLEEDGGWNGRKEGESRGVEERLM